ncbi:MAG: glycosyl transferase family 2 [Betaproteobacteria bacterium CG2_30_68_42]|nr:MAG: glycosyl transferase family 2 [Betaproteobacteria bacterium CG2_30_68_42]
MEPERRLVSVVIPAYNAGWCVARAVDSALQQTHAAREIIVVDDGSQDDTAAVLARYGDAVRVVHKPNGGLSSARNAGIAAARGEYVALLDADDSWLPGKLAAQVALMDSRPELGFCSVAARVEDSQGRLLNLWPCPQWRGSFLEHLFREPAAVAASGSGVLVRRSLFERVGPFDEALASLEDIDMWMRLSAAAQYACVAEPLAVILKRADSMSRNLDVMRDAAIRVMRKNRALLPERLRGAHWRDGLAGVFADYAKWQYRIGRRTDAVLDVMRAFALAPLSRGRLCLGLLRDMALGRPL